MTVWQRIIIIALCVLGTMLTRFLPFILFQKKKIIYLTLLKKNKSGANKDIALLIYFLVK